jgi:hypothetical protein
MCPFCPRRCSVVARAHGPSNPGVVKNGPTGARCRGIRPRTSPSRTVNAAPNSLDQWSRPPARAPGVRAVSPMPMSLRNARPAGNRHSCGDAPLTVGREHRLHAARDAGGSGEAFPDGGARRPSPLEAASPLGILTCGRCPECRRWECRPAVPAACQLAASRCALRGGRHGLPETVESLRRLCVGQAGARVATAGPCAGGSAGFPGARRGRARTGLCAPATGDGGREARGRASPV